MGLLKDLERLGYMKPTAQAISEIADVMGSRKMAEAYSKKKEELDRWHAIEVGAVQPSAATLTASGGKPTGDMQPAAPEPVGTGKPPGNVSKEQGKLSSSMKETQQLWKMASDQAFQDMQTRYPNFKADKELLMRELGEMDLSRRRFDIESEYGRKEASLNTVTMLGFLQQGDIGRQAASAIFQQQQATSSAREATDRSRMLGDQMRLSALAQKHGIEVNELNALRDITNMYMSTYIEQEKLNAYKMQIGAGLRERELDKRQMIANQGLTRFYANVSELANTPNATSDQQAVVQSVVNSRSGDYVDQIKNGFDRYVETGKMEHVMNPIGRIQKIAAENISKGISVGYWQEMDKFVGKVRQDMSQIQPYTQFGKEKTGATTTTQPTYFGKKPGEVAGGTKITVNTSLNQGQTFEP
jgi:hypothetical protein